MRLWPSQSERLELGQKTLKLLLPGCARLECHYPPKAIPSPSEAALPRTRPGVIYPRISVVVPSFNHGHFLGETLCSIVAQQYPDLQLLVVDGGSTDETADVISAYEKHIDWWVSEPDEGQANAINKGMAHASGDILAWLNSDDCLMPGALLRVAHSFMASPKPDVVYGHRVLINEEGLDVGKWILPGHRRFILGYADYIPQETMFWRKSLWLKSGGKLDESFRFAMDWELIQRFIKADARFKVIPAFLGQFRMHAAQKTSANIESDGFREMEIIRRACRESFSSQGALQNLYYLMQRASLFSFLLRARLTELLLKMKLINIH